MNLSNILLWNAFWTFVWAGMHLTFLVLLFRGSGNGIYRALKLYMLLISLFFIRIGILIYIDVVHNPDIYYASSIVQALIAPIGVLSVVYLALEIRKSKH